MKTLKRNTQKAIAVEKMLLNIYCVNITDDVVQIMANFSNDGVRNLVIWRCKAGAISGFIYFYRYNVEVMLT